MQNDQKHNQSQDQKQKQDQGHHKNDGLDQNDIQNQNGIQNPTDALLCEQMGAVCQLPCVRLQNVNTQALPEPNVCAIGSLPETSAVNNDEERIIMEVTQRLAQENRIRVHYYVKIAVSVFLCALLLAFGIPVFMASRMTGSLSYTALGVVLIAFGLVLAISVVVLLFKPPQILRDGASQNEPQGAVHNTSQGVSQNEPQGAVHNTSQNGSHNAQQEEQ